MSSECQHSLAHVGCGQHRRISLRRAADVTLPNTTKVTKTGNARVIDIDVETLRVLKALKSDRGAISLDLARADAYVFGDDKGAIRVPDAVTSRWTRRLDWATAKIEGLPRVTLKGLRHTHATLLLELGEHPRSSRNASGTPRSPRPSTSTATSPRRCRRAPSRRFAAHLGDDVAGA